jgi:carboxypeptidase A1
LIDTLLDGYGKNNRITTMLDTFEVFVAPLLNPDGYEFSRASNRYWRKNRRSNGKGVYGVDLNRNWDINWGLVGTMGNYWTNYHD